MYRKHSQEKTLALRFPSAFVVLSIVAVFTSVAAADLTFDLNYTYNGTPPEESTPPPWLRATFVDGALPDTVDLTLTATNLSDSEYVGGWYFNVHPDFEDYLGDLQFSAPVVISGSFDDPNVNIALDAYKANGDGWFDILIEFATEDGASDHRFNAGDSVKYTISGIESLEPSSFDCMSAEDGAGTGLYPTAAHIRGIDGTSGYVTVPEPASIALLGLGALALLRKRRT